MAVKGPCVFTSYLFFLSCREELFFRKVLFLTERSAEPPGSTVVSLEGGVVRSLLRSNQKSSDRLVVTPREAA
jgi:hypothetical protein